MQSFRRDCAERDVAQVKIEANAPRSADTPTGSAARRVVPTPLPRNLRRGTIRYRIIPARVRSNGRKVPGHGTVDRLMMRGVGNLYVASNRYDCSTNTRLKFRHPAPYVFKRHRALQPTGDTCASCSSGPLR